MDQNDQSVLIEMEERIEKISSVIAALRPVIDEGKAVRQLIDELFINVHSLKASAQTFGFTALARLTHECENLLYSIKIGNVRVDEGVQALLVESTEAFLNALKTPDVDSNAVNVLTKLEQICFDSNPHVTETVSFELPADVSEVLSEEQMHRLFACHNEGAGLFTVSTKFDVADFDQQFQQLKRILSQSGEIISTAPTVRTDEPDKLDFRILYTSHSNIETVRAVVASLKEVTVTEQTVAGGRNDPTERLLNRVVLAGQVAADLCGKGVEFEWSLDGTLNKTICDELSDALVHLVRNAVDHGIETRDDRVALGKSMRGKVAIKVLASADPIRISVSDDGRGIDPQLIRVIFRSGFSTKTEVSETSGRGVGIDVVQTAVKRLGGQISVASEVGQGSTFEILLPAP